MATDPTREPGWVPPHCPRSCCRHHNQLPRPWPFIRKGYYTRSSNRVRVQRFRCRTFGRPDSQSVRKDVTELLDVALARVDQAVLHSDGHRTYRLVIGKLRPRIVHRVTDSRKPRTAQNPLFEINLFDLLIRHAQGNHKRETIAFSKRRQSSAERLVLLQLWRNWMHRRREKGPDETPAMLKGLAERPLRMEEIYRERLFPAHGALPPRWRQYYERTVRTREYVHNRRHELKYAF